MSKVAFWNTADLFPPPENECSVPISLNDVNNLQEIFKSAHTALKELKTLDFEAAMLSRTIWRLKSRLRKDKMLHRIEAVNRGLLKYLALNITNVYEEFGIKLRDPLRRKLNSSETVLPSRQMLEWVLVRTQGFARLFCYLAHSCEEAAKPWIDPIKRGYIFNDCPIVLGMIARIWAITKSMIVHACYWYKELLPFRLNLKSVGLRWLPSDYILPENLTLWLNMPHITNITSMVKTEKTSSIFGMSLMQLLDMSDDEESKEVKQDEGEEKGLKHFLNVNDEEDCKVLEQDQGNKKRKLHSLTMSKKDNSKKKKISQMHLLDLSDEYAKVDTPPKKKQKSLCDFLVDSDNEEASTSSITHTKISKNPSFTRDVNDSVDIGEVVPREIKQVPAVMRVPKKNKQKEMSNMFIRQPNTRALDQCTASSSNNTEKKKVKHNLPKESPTVNIVNKQKIDSAALTSSKKKKQKKMKNRRK